MERGRRCGICVCTLVVAMMVVGLLAGGLRVPVPVLAATSPTLTLSRSAASYTENDGAFYVDDGIAISGFTDTIEGARVSIGSGFVAAEDNLSCSASGGISASYNASTGILTLTGTATSSAYQTVLQSVRYSNASDNPSTAARVITVALSGSSLYNSDNGHYYEFVASAGISWSSARTAADDLDLYGMQGYLATITSASENAFLTQKVSGSAWIGASDTTTEGDWRWVTGPEAGNALTYTNWNADEPNNSNGDEDCAHMMSWTSPAGQWNDLPDAGGSGQYASTGYMVEYGGMPGDPEVHLSGTVTVTVVRVNDAPVIVAGSVLAIDEDSGAATRNVIVPSDPDSNVFTYAVVAAPSKGMASFPTASANQYRYTPNANANGSDSFTWRVYDGEAYSNVVTQTVTIAAVNDGPSLTTPAPLTVDEDTAGMITGLVVADIDVDETSAPNNTVQTSLAASHGTLTLFSTTGLSFASGDGTADSAMTFVGTLVDTNAALDALSYRPHADFNGLDACSVTISDLGHTGSGGARTAMRSVAITITPVNDAPVASSMSLTTREDTALAGTLAGSDVDSSLLSYSIATQPVHGNVVLDDVGTGAFTYTPTPDYNGPDAFTFKVSDGAADSGTATVTLTVTAVNDVPSFTKGSNQTVNEDSGTQTVPAWATSISAGPANEAGQQLTFHVSNDNTALFNVQPSITSSGILTYTPTADANGSATVTVHLHDDGGTANGGVDTTANQTFTLTVTAVADIVGDTGTTLEDQAVSLDVLANDTFEGSPVITAVSTPSLGSVTIVGGSSLLYTPTADVNGADSFTYTVTSPAGITETATVTLTITPVNDVPSFTGGPDVTVDEDCGLQTISAWATGISAGPADEAGQQLTFHVSNDNTALFNVQPSITSSGILTYTPTADANGSATVTVHLHDDGGTANGGVDTTANQTFTLTITPVNDVSSFTGGPDVTVDEDCGLQTISAWATGISAGPANEAGQSLTFLVTNDSPALFGSQPSLSPSGALTFTPIPDRNGVAHVTVTLTDDTTAGGPALTTAPQTFVITVRPINDAPVCVQPPSLRGVSIAGAILAGDPGAWTDENDQAPGTIMLSFQWMRTRDRNGADPEPILGATSLTYMVSKADNGYFLTLRVTATDDGESLPATRSTVAVTRFVLAYDNADDLTLSFPDFSTLPGIMDPIGTRAAMLDGTVTPSFMVRNRLFSFLFTLTNAQGTMASWTIRLNGIVTASSQGLGNIAAPLSLAEGTNEVTVQVSSGSTTLIRHAIIFCDSTPPALTLNVTKATPTSIVLDGSVFDAISGVRLVTVDGMSLVPALDGTLSGMIPRPASSSMDVTVVDRAGNTATLQLAVPPATSTSSQSHRLVLTIGKDRMAVDGKTVLLDAVPEIRSGRTFLPIRAVVEQLGGTITWDAPTRTVTIDHGGHTIVLTIGSRTARVNGVVVSLETVPFIRSGRTFLPVRFIAENLGYEIEWDGQARTVTILW